MRDRTKPPEQVFRALSDETRLRLLSLLLQADDTLCVCEMIEAIEQPQYQVSRHLRVLREAELVTSKRQGTWMYYRLNDQIDRHQILFGFLKSYLSQTTGAEHFARDTERLQERLALREDGICVVGGTQE